MYGIRVILENKNNVKSMGPLLKFIHIFFIFLSKIVVKGIFGKSRGSWPPKPPPPPPPFAPV